MGNRLQHLNRQSRAHSIIKLFYQPVRDDKIQMKVIQWKGQKPKNINAKKMESKYNTFMLSRTDNEKQNLKCQNHDFN